MLHSGRYNEVGHREPIGRRVHEAEDASASNVVMECGIVDATSGELDDDTDLTPVGDGASYYKSSDEGVVTMAMADVLRSWRGNHVISAVIIWLS